MSDRDVRGELPSWILSYRHDVATTGAPPGRRWCPFWAYNDPLAPALPPNPHSEARVSNRYCSTMACVWIDIETICIIHTLTLHEPTSIAE